MLKKKNDSLNEKSATPWVNLNEAYPKKTEGFVLGCDWYSGEKEEDLRMMICELPVIDKYWCGIKNGHALNVFNSTCPCIGYGWNAHWMEIPANEWIEFDYDKYPYNSSGHHEVLIKLKNGNYYTGFIEVSGLMPSWCPSFNMMKHGDYQDIEYWRDLPDSPKFVVKKALYDEEKKIQKEWMEKFKI